MKALLIISLMLNMLFAKTAFLMPEEAFKSDLSINADVLQVRFDLGEGIYLYKDRIDISTQTDGVTLEALAFPKAQLHNSSEVFMDQAVITSKLKSAVPDLDSVTFTLSYQGCSEKGLCYEPIEKQFVVPLSTKLTPPSTQASTMAVSESDTIAATFASGNIALILLSFFGFGLMLALTPCVFPMIPILSSIIVAQGEGMSAKKGLLFALVYVFAMSIAYALAGVLAGLFGSNIQASMQNPWVISAFAGLFVVLAFSMFGFFEIGLPASVQSRLMNRSDKAGSKGGLPGVAMMGFLSALIVGPCVAPPLAGALIYIGQSGDALLGGAALFVMSLGMGAPLLLIGTGAGRFMPKPGGWMQGVTKTFGVVMLAIAIWMLDRIVPASVTMVLLALLLIISSVYLRAFESLREGHSGWSALRKGSGVFIFATGVLMLLGALSGAANPLQPLERFTSVHAAALPTQAKTEFLPVRSLEELEGVLAKHQGKKVLLDFYAQWCTSCKEMEHITFADPGVKSALNDYVLIQADLTANGSGERALAKKYGIFGPPAIVFFDEQGDAVPSRTVVGYKGPQELISYL